MEGLKEVGRLAQLLAAPYVPALRAALRHVPQTVQWNQGLLGILADPDLEVCWRRDKQAAIALADFALSHFQIFDRHEVATPEY